MTEPKLCNTPCIINASSGYHLVFCQEKHGHDGDHVYRTKAQHTERGVVVSWFNAGNSGYGHISSAPSMTNRCREWVHVQNLLKFHQGHADPMGNPSLLHITIAETSSFCCEKNPGHDGEHMRSGLFRPLGIQWKIVW